jgi:hypothetical protein
MAEVTINNHVFQVHSETFERFRCGKTITTVELRKADTEIVITTAGDWRQLLLTPNNNKAVFEQP